MAYTKEVSLIGVDSYRLPVYQYDYGLNLSVELESLGDYEFEVHADIGEPEALIIEPEVGNDMSTGNTILSFKVPDKSLALEREVSNLWIYCTNSNSGITVKRIILDIINRKRPADVPPADIDIVELKGFAESARESAEAAERSRVLAETASADFVTDQEFDGSSINPQSGRAVSKVFAPANRKNVNGQIIVVDDASPVPTAMDIIVRGKNILRYPYHEGTKELKGISFIVNDDGTVVLNGTATESISFNLFLSTAGVIPLVVGEYYTYRCLLTPGSYQSIYSYINCGGKNSFDLGNGGVTFKATDNVLGNVAIVVAKGTVLEDVVLKPQLEIGTEATEYEQYIDPSNIKVLSSGKNLIPYPYYEQSTTRNGVTFTINSTGTITAKGTATNGGAWFSVSKDELNLKAGQKYRFTCCPSGGSMEGYHAYIKVAEDAYLYDIGNGINVSPEADIDTVITLVVCEGVTVSGITFTPQLELGDKSTEYEIYRGQIISAESTGIVNGMVCISPKMILMTNTSGVKIECGYTTNLDYLPKKNEVSNAIKQVVTGDIINVDDVSSLKHDLNVMVRGKNLIPYPYSETTKVTNGITFVDNGDGSVTLNGVATAQANFIFSGDIKLVGGETYVMDSNSGEYIIILSYIDSHGKTHWIGQKNTFEWRDDYVFGMIYLQVAPDTVCENLVVRPQLEVGNDCTEYTPYVSTENSTVIVRGKNLFNADSLQLKQFSKDLNVYDRGFSFVNTLANKSSYIISQIFLKKGEYRISGSASSSDGSTKVGVAVMFENNYNDFVDNHSSAGVNFTFTIPKDGIYNIGFYANYTSPAGTTTTFKNIQIEAGTVATEYSPYVEAQEVKVDGVGIAKGLTSITPYMNIMVDKSGLGVRCEYNADTKRYIDKKFAELQALILEV